MSDRRTLRVLFFLFLISLTVSTGLAQRSDGQIKRVATLGLLTKYADGNGQNLQFVDLTLREPESDTPYLYEIRCNGQACPFQVGRTYKANMYGAGGSLYIDSIVIEGGKSRISAGGVSDSLSPSRAEACDPPLSPKGGHWELDPFGAARCKPGREETIKWTPDAPEQKADTRVSTQGNKSKKNNKNIPACNDHAGYSNTTLTVVITVKPAPNQTWKFPEAPATVADRILTGLNNNKRGITFKEASGELPNLRIDVIMSETNEGTQQDSASVQVSSADFSFNENSGTAPYVGWQNAVDHLSNNMVEWFEGGYHTSGTCVRPDGTVRNQ